jgi:DNA-binding XRE family transcriptional regulator
MLKDIELAKMMLRYRAEKNISQSDLAKLCNLTPQTVCHVENGIQSPSNLTKQKILNLIEKGD